jgi:hypothetical protein
MTAGRISLICWIFYGAMCAAFLPLAYGIDRLHLLPGTAGLALAIVVVAVLWWGPFGYAMYLSMAVTKNGDPRLLRRGIRGTAVVLSARATGTVIQTGEPAWQAPRVHKYRLRVTVPGRASYETDCAICLPGLRPGQTVDVAISPHNHKRVTISRELEQDEVPPQTGRVYTFQAGEGGFDLNLGATRPRPPEAERIQQLTDLGRLHRDGVLTDAEFAQEKARILGT